MPGRDTSEIPPGRGLPPGTPVLTPAGPVPAGTLQPGMLVLAVSGAGAPFQHVADVRRNQVPGPAIRIRAGALDDGTPQQDLVLPAAHALLLGGALVAAGALVDGHGIVTEPDQGPIEVVEIHLHGHDAVLAAGAAAETAPGGPGVPDCAPRRPPDGALLAMLAWRAERMGWARPAPDLALPVAGALHERLMASPLAPLDLGLPVREEN